MGRPIRQTTQAFAEAMFDRALAIRAVIHREKRRNWRAGGSNW
jgi:hypothetical protein